MFYRRYFDYSEGRPHFINYNQVYKTDQNQYTNNNYAFNGGPFDVKSITFDQNNLPWFSTGSSVSWINDDSAAHTVTSGTVDAGLTGIFDSGLFISGGTFEFTFDDAGTYDYFCMVHPWMTGQVIVN